MTLKINNILKWFLIGISVAAFIFAIIYLLPSNVPIEEQSKISWKTSIDSPIIPPPMPNMTLGDNEDILKDNLLIKGEKEKELPYAMEENVPPPPPEEEVKKQEVIIKTPSDGRPKIAIIIDDMGLNHPLSIRATKLPKEITLSYLPYSSNLKKQTKDALSLGHELMLHFPMEPIGKQNPGPNALLTSQTPEEWEKIIKINLDSFTGFVGVNNHMGSKFTTNGMGLTFVANALYKRGVFFVDSRTIAGSLGAKVMHIMKVKTASRDVFLDHIVEKKAILKELYRAEEIARKKGYAIIIGHPHLETILVLEKWVTSPEFKEFNLVSVSELVK